MRFRVLGPIRMAPRTPSAAKPRSVLATLLVHSGSVVSTHTLIDELWSMEPPRTAATTLQVYVSQLRKALQEGEGADAQEQLLLTRPPGYLIRVADGELDLTVFESLRAAGHRAFDRQEFDRASELLGRALALWNGPALSGIPHGPTLGTSAIRLDELRTEVLEQRVSADLRLGRHQELIGELMALAHENPMREALHCQLMVALYRAGRQSDALQAYHRARRALIDELGVEPGPGLSRLFARILASDPALAWHKRPGGAGSAAREARPVLPAPEGPPVWLPPAVADLTGREGELTLGVRALTGEAAVRPRVLALSGRAGVGKTALAVRLAHDLADRFPDGRILLPLRDADGRAVEPGAAMATLLRRLRGTDSGTPGAGPPSGQDELSDLLRRHTQGRRVLLVLDDAVSEAQIRPLLIAVPDSGVIVTSRRTLGALEAGHRLVVDVLGPRPAEQLLLASGGPRMGEDVSATAEIARLCGGLPLALRVAAAGLATRPHWTSASLAQRLRDERTRLAALSLSDLDVRGSLMTVYQDVGPAERRAFRLLALAPLPDFAVWSAAALLGMDTPEAERQAEELVRAHLLEARPRPDGHTPLRYGFHTLLRTLSIEALAEAAPGTAADATERLALAYLVLARYADSSLTPGRDPLARIPVADVAAPPDAVTPSGQRVVGTAALRWFREETAGLLESVRRTHASGRWQLCGALASAAGGYFEVCALWDDWETAHELALDAARQAADSRMEAAVLRSLGDLAWQRRHFARALSDYRLAGRLFTRCDERAAAGRCLSGEADVLLGRGAPAGAEDGYLQALSVSRSELDARGEADASRGLALTALHGGRFDEALARLADCAAAAQRAGDRRWVEYARRTADQVRTAGESRRGPYGRTPVEIRPGLWLLAPRSAAPTLPAPRAA